MGQKFVRKIPPQIFHTPAVQRSSHRPRLGSVQNSHGLFLMLDTSCEARRMHFSCLKLANLIFHHHGDMYKTHWIIQNHASLTNSTPFHPRPPFFLIPFPSNASCKRPKLWSWTGACLPNISATPEDLKVQKSPTEQPPFFQRKTAFGSCFPCA